MKDKCRCRSCENQKPKSDDGDYCFKCATGNCSQCGLGSRGG